MTKVEKNGIINTEKRKEQTTKIKRKEVVTMTTTINTKEITAKVNTMNKNSLEWWKRVLDIQLNRPAGYAKITFNGVQYKYYNDIQTLKNIVNRRLREMA